MTPRSPGHHGSPSRARDSRAVRYSVAWIRALERLGAHALRPGTSDDLVACFADEARELAASPPPRGGAARVIGLAARATGDLLFEALVLRLWRHRGNRRRVPGARSGAPSPSRSRGRSHDRTSRQDGEPMFRDFASDLRMAARALRRRPLWALGIVATLTLGVASTIAVYAVIDALLLRPLPYGEPGRLVRVWGEDRTAGQKRLPLNPLDVVDLSRGAAAIEAIGAWTRTSQALSGAGDPFMVSVAFATPGLFRTLGVDARIGRVLGPEHESAERENEVLVSHAFWAGRLGADPAILGRTIRLADVPCTIVGVLPPEFASPNATLATEPEVWRPFIVKPADGRGGHFMMAAARLRRGASIAQAQEQIDAVVARLESEEPSTNRGKGAYLEPLARSVAGESWLVLAVLMAAVCFVLLIACANAANLLLARAAARRREMAVRGALGAGRWRIVRQMLCESLLLSGAASAFGVATAWGVLRLMPIALRGALPAVQPLAVDGRVIAFAVVLAGATALLFGLAPALAASGGGRLGLGALLAGSGGGGARGTTTDSRRFQLTLLTAETALASMLLISAMLLVRSADRLQRVDPGFASEGVLTFRVALPRARYGESAAVRAFAGRLEEQLHTLPGVVAAGGVNIGPLAGRNSCDSFGLGDRPAPPDGAEPCAESRIATPGYFGGMGIALRAGRTFDATDTENAAQVVVINEAMARLHWPGGNPLGQTFKWGSVTSDDSWKTVIGVVGDVRHFGRDAEAPPEVYMPSAQRPSRALTFAVRTLAGGRDPGALVPEVRATIAAIDPTLPISEVFSTGQLLERSNALHRLRTQMLGVFSLIALALALVGIYGVSSFLTAQRYREIGIRAALGATPGDIRREILVRALGAPILGLILGLVGSLAAARVLRSLLFGVSATDPIAFAVVPTILLAAALLAGFVPARRAAAADPLAALRAE